MSEWHDPEEHHMTSGTTSEQSYASSVNDEHGHSNDALVDSRLDGPGAAEASTNHDPLGHDHSAADHLSTDLSGASFDHEATFSSSSGHLTQTHSATNDSHSSMEMSNSSLTGLRDSAIDNDMGGIDIHNIQTMQESYPGPLDTTSSDDYNPHQLSSANGSYHGSFDSNGKYDHDNVHGDNGDDDDDGFTTVARKPRGGVYNGSLTLTVGSPQKVVEGTSSFITYLVTSERPRHPAERVRRRFSDFVKLYSQLVAEYPGCAVPPLPDYSRLEYIAGDRFSSDFTSRRAASLQRFLFRLLRHPDLSSSRALAAFLAPRDMMGGRRGSGLMNGIQDVAANGINGDGGVIDALSDSLLNAFAKVKYQSKEMLEARDRADRFEHNVATVDKAFLRMSRRQAEIVHDLSDMHKQASLLARLEPAVATEFEILARASKAVAASMAELHGNMDTTFAGALRDMMHYVQAIKALLKQREQRQIDYEALIEYLQRTEAEHAAAQNGTTITTSSYLRTKVNDFRGVDKERARQERIAKLAQRITDLRSEVSRAKKVSSSFEEVAKREVTVFEATEALELKSSLTSIADGHIAFFTKVLEDCKAIERDFANGISGVSHAASPVIPEISGGSAARDGTP